MTRSWAWLEAVTRAGQREQRQEQESTLALRQDEGGKYLLTGKCTSGGCVGSQWKLEVSLGKMLHTRYHVLWTRALFLGISIFFLRYRLRYLVSCATDSGTYGFQLVAARMRRNKMSSSAHLSRETLFNIADIERKAESIEKSPVKSEDTSG